MTSVVSLIEAYSWYELMISPFGRADVVLQYDILPSQMVERLVFATSVMHAYGHQWSCQLVYNPRLRPGLGLTEADEEQGQGRRLCIVDEHVASTVRATDFRYWYPTSYRSW